MTAATQAHRSVESQRKVWRGVEKRGRTGDKLRSPYDVCNTADERLGLIGSAIKAAGGDWITTHKRQMDWLASQGITAAQAVARHQEWIDAEMTNSFWKPARKR